MNVKKTLLLLGMMLGLSLSNSNPVLAVELADLYAAKYNPSITSELFIKELSQLSLLDKNIPFSDVIELAQNSNLSTAQINQFITYSDQLLGSEINNENISTKIVLFNTYSKIKETEKANALYQRIIGFCDSIPTGNEKDRILSEILVSSTNYLPFQLELWKQIQSSKVKITMIAALNPSPYLIEQCPSNNISSESKTQLAIAWEKANQPERVIEVLDQFPNLTEQLWAISQLLQHTTSTTNKEVLNKRLQSIANSSTDITQQTIAYTLLLSISSNISSESTTQYLNQIYTGYPSCPLIDQIKITLITAPVCLSLNRIDILLHMYDEILKQNSNSPTLVRSGMKEINSKLVIWLLKNNRVQQARQIEQEFNAMGIDNTAILALFQHSLSQKNSTLSLEYAQKSADPFFRKCRYHDLVAQFGEKAAFNVLL